MEITVDIPQNNNTTTKVKVDTLKQLKPTIKEAILNIINQPDGVRLCAADIQKRLNMFKKICELYKKSTTNNLPSLLFEQQLELYETTLYNNFTKFEGNGLDGVPIFINKEAMARCYADLIYQFVTLTIHINSYIQSS
ncbi:hypothetical protein EIN_055240 [Entamoeba invadens IP1]|uniref:hypothetical protein n=1 Tax=Entamoeba invadens IP1 TaxID=370355 RepID=UPI0002C3D41F|nr:hypothetical protein EIN_055240 [Entamoeba invadens IP1]ELP93219.1 hypothetical protein EIN_055240 [Entamoeba invadens IP1]|eukprot:XP_004259990.1 hypothetical protein EIN_055240 [Entamoeba invadens IP1]